MRIVNFTMQSFLMIYLAPFAVALAVSLFFTPLVRKFALRYKFASYPKRDRWRKRVVASLGGIAIFIAFLIPYLILTPHSLKSMGFIFGAFGIFWLGLLDDIVHIKPDTKLIGQIVVACSIILFGIRFEIAPSPIVNVMLTILWIVGVANAFNLLDNMDGLCAGVASISALILCAHSTMNKNPQLVILSAIILGATLGFLRYNFNPAKIFMGDCGSLFLGYVLSAGLLLAGTPKEHPGFLIAVMVPALILAVPILDTVFVTFMRTLNNRPISQGGKDHTSHRLVALGLSERKAVLLLYAISAVCGLCGLLYTRFAFIHFAIVLGVLFIGLFILGVFLGTEVRIYSSGELGDYGSKKKFNGKIVFSGFVYNKRRIVEVALDFIIISISYIAAFMLRFEGGVFDLNIPLIIESLPVIVIIKFLMFYFFGLYRGVWRYIGLYDIIAIFKATALGSIVSIVALVFFLRFRYYSRTVFIIDWLLTFVSVSGVRILFRLYKEFFANIRVGGKRVLIFGAGDAGEMALREIRQNLSLALKPIGFVDDDRTKLDRIIHGVRVLGETDDLEKLIYRHKIDEVLMAVPALGKKRFEEVRRVCDGTGVSFREVSKIIQVKKQGE